MKLALGHTFDGFFDGPGDAFVFDIGAGIGRPAILLVGAGLAVMRRLVVDLRSVDLQPGTGLDLCALAGEGVAGIDGQLAGRRNGAGVRGGFAVGVVAALMAELRAAAGPVEAVGVVDAAASGSLLGGVGSAVMGRQ